MSLIFCQYDNLININDIIDSARSIRLHLHGKDKCKLTLYEQEYACEYLKVAAPQ